MGKKKDAATGSDPTTDVDTSMDTVEAHKARKKKEKSQKKQRTGTTTSPEKTSSGKKKSGKTKSDEKKPGKTTSDALEAEKAERKAVEKAERKAVEKAEQKAAKAERKRLKKLVEAARSVPGAPDTVEEALAEVGASEVVPGAVVDVADLVSTSFVDALRVGEGFRLTDVDPSSTPGFSGTREEAETLMAAAEPEIADLQERLYADSRAGGGASVLLVVQGLDTAGKGGIMRHVVGLLDPQGTTIHAFKQPTPEERRRPFLWRIRRQLPAPGMVGVFDRSHYEDVLVARVDDLVPASTWRRRYGQIRTFENSVVRGGTTIVKVMLHIGNEEQRARLAERLERADKHWKYNPGDIDTRRKWDAYGEAYQEALVKTSTDEAPWFVVPADRKWYARLAVQQLLLDALRRVDPQWPRATFDVEEEKARLADS